jgi:acetyl esterase/lipase
LVVGFGGGGAATTTGGGDGAAVAVGLGDGEGDGEGEGDADGEAVGVTEAGGEAAAVSLTDLSGSDWARAIITSVPITDTTTPEARIAWVRGRSRWMRPRSDQGL